MNTNSPNGLGYLEQIRQENGSDSCKEALEEVARKNRQKAVSLLNDPKITFPCLFLLTPQIKTYRFSPQLNQRNKIALNFSEKILNPQANPAVPAAEEEIHSVLKWMVETGSRELLEDDDYEQILDIAVSVLCGTYQDQSVLAAVDQMIFERNQKGRNIHDLVWAVFKIRHPNVLKKVAEHIDASNPEEAGLACNLLNIDPPKENSAEERKKKKQEYVQWLEENDPYLYFTEESFQFCSQPAVCRVDLERKYLQKEESTYLKKEISPAEDLNEDECQCLQQFQSLGSKEKQLLSECSCKMYRENVPGWEKWMHLSAAEQMKAAKARLEGRK